MDSGRLQRGASLKAAIYARKSTDDKSAIGQLDHAERCAPALSRTDDEEFILVDDRSDLRHSAVVLVY
jgi:hypothetical protein